MNKRPKILGRLLIDAGVVTEDALRQALVEQKLRRLRIGETLVALGLATEEDVARGLAVQLGLPYAPPPLEPKPEARRLVEDTLAMERRIVPLTASARRLGVAMADPLDLATVDDLQFQTGRRVEPVVASASSVQAALDGGGGPALGRLVAALPEELRAVDTEKAEDLEAAMRSAPVVQLVDRILHDAVEGRASDIHLEETGADVRVRYRVDGVLRRAVDLPAASRRAVLSRIKVMAGMDISVRRRAQDGRIAWAHETRRLTLRVSTLPVNGGEKAVVRILDPESAPRNLDGLGLAATDRACVRSLLALGEGVILAAGPTGSGKSTTLFAALSEIDRKRLNVVTLEDPVEYRLPGANQVQVDPRAGLGFAEALRAVLRQDPDVVMVGEIRDRETAEIAMAAAVTGHLVLSTIHTTDAPGTITRLLNMGVPPFLVAGGLRGVVAQRLVRRTCAACRGSGCDACLDGHRGRTGAFQVLAVTDAIRDEIVGEARTQRLRVLAREAGMGSLAEDARRAVAEGLTTPHEIGKLLHADPGTSLSCPSCGGTVPVQAFACPHCGHARR
ncbi:MAG: ATPase, T2SS/T4P/T4SS family, partial [Planctomycetota bacterium]